MDLSIAVKINGNQLETQCCGSRGFVAPEVLNKEGYGVKADIFSCGLLIYYLYISLYYFIFFVKKFFYRLTGKPAFEGDSLDEILFQNKIGEVYYEGDLWKEYTPEAKDLIIRMTQKDPYKRISAKDCLKHKWLNMSFKNNKRLSIASTNSDFSDTIKQNYKKHISDKVVSKKSASPRVLSKMLSEKVMDCSPIDRTSLNLKAVHRKVSSLKLPYSFLLRGRKDHCRNFCRARKF